MTRDGMNGSNAMHKGFVQDMSTILRLSIALRA